MKAPQATWYHIHYWLMLTFSGLLALICILTIYISPLNRWEQKLNTTLTLLIMAVLEIIYLLIVYKVIKKFNLLLASVIGSMLFALLILNGLAINNRHLIDLIYVGGWFIVAIFSGLYGLSPLLGLVFVSIAYSLIESRFQVKHLGIDSWLIISTIGVATLAYLVSDRMTQKARIKQSTGLSRMFRSDKQQSEIIIQSIADGVIVFDTTYTITLINAAAAQLSEWTVKDATGLDVRLVLLLAEQDNKNPEINKNIFDKALHEPANRTMLLTGHNKKIVIVSVVMSPIVIPPDNQVVGAVVVFRDVTEERKAEQQRSDFISTASHEMRTPIASIEGYLALALNDKVSTIDDKTRSFLVKAHQSTENLGKLFQDLLTSANAEDGRLNNHPVKIEMGTFLEQLIEDSKVNAYKKNLITEFNVGVDNDSTAFAGTKVVRPLYYIYADPIHLREVVTNLLDNAIKYTSQGKISINLSGDDSTVRFSVRDTGVGIPADDISHLFQKFYRVDNSATRLVGGTGLGLFICRKIVELYGGNIWVESEIGKGSTFFVSLPRYKDTEIGSPNSGQTVIKPQVPTATKDHDTIKT